MSDTAIAITILGVMTAACALPILGAKRPRKRRCKGLVFWKQGQLRISEFIHNRLHPSKPYFDVDGTFSLLWYTEICVVDIVEGPKFNTVFEIGKVDVDPIELSEAIYRIDNGFEGFAFMERMLQRAGLLDAAPVTTKTSWAGRESHAGTGV